MKIKKYLRFTASFQFVLLLFTALAHSADTLDINTDYRVRGISYTNNDFDEKTADSKSFYSQRVMISLNGHFDENIEICSKITALGVPGSTSSATIFNYTLPYPNTTFNPYIENAYIKLHKPAGMPFDATIGKQPIEFGDGFIIADNGAGNFALKLTSNYKYYVPIKTDVFTMTLNKNMSNDAGRSVFGVNNLITWKKHDIEVYFFNDSDNTDNFYVQGSTAIETSQITKKFIGFRIEKITKLLEYKFELAKQTGIINKNNGSSIDMDGMGYCIMGKLKAEKSKLGKVSAHALIQIATGDDNPTSTADGDEAFTPDLCKRFDGMERIGYGKLFAANCIDSFFPLPKMYSGINTINIGTEFSPIYGLTLNIDYFLYSASKSLIESQTPQVLTSNFERYFGANYSLGIEMDLGAKVEISKYLDMAFSYSRYTPPYTEVSWPNRTDNTKRDPATAFNFEVRARF